MLIKTENSLYQLDLTKKRIRRLHGKSSPTNRQGQDEAWKDYHDVSEPVVNEPLMIIWTVESDLAKTTMTSLITSIEEIGGLDNRYGVC